MDPNKFTQKTNDAIAAAQSLAVKNGQQQIEVEHLLLALIEQEKGIVSKILQKSSIDPAAYKKAVEDEIRKLPSVSGPGAQPGQVFVTQRLNRIIVASEEIAQRMQDEFISVEHLFLAIMDEHGSTGAGSGTPVSGHHGRTRLHRSGQGQQDFRSDQGQSTRGHDLHPREPARDDRQPGSHL